MKRDRPYSPLTTEAARILGGQVATARRERRWTINDLAERVGATPRTIRKVERGDLTVSLGIALETAAILGVTLFSDDPARRRLEAARIDDRLALLPRAVRQPRRVRDEF